MAKRFSQIDRDEFVRAARRGDEELVRKYLDGGIAVDTVSSKGFTALVSAVAGRHTDIVKLLLKLGCNPNLSVDAPKQDEAFSRTALNVAAGKADFELIDLLLDHGAEPRMIAMDGGTAGHLLVFEWPIIKGYKDGAADLKLRLERMIAAGVPINQVDSHRRTMLARAVEVEAPVSLLSWLIEKGADVNAVAENGRSMLHSAVTHGHIEAVRFFAGQGIGVDRADELGRTPIFDTTDETIGSLLISLGTNIDHRDVHGRTPLADLVASHSVPGYAPSWTTFLLRSGANLDAPDFSGNTPRALIRTKRLTALNALVHAHEARSVLRSAATRAQANRAAP